MDAFLDKIPQKDMALFSMLAMAHDEATSKNDNASRNAFHSALDGSGNLYGAVAAAILHFGNLHAPVSQARQVFRTATEDDIKKVMETEGLRVPGVGNSFFRTTIDPAFADVDNYMFQRYHEYWERLQQIAKWAGRPPNAALYTAAVMEALKMDEWDEVVTLLICRIPVWIAEARDRKHPKVWNGLPLGE